MNKYLSYKQTGVEWIGDIPKHWEFKRLKFVATANPSSIDKKSVEGESAVRLCNYTDVYNNEFITPDLEFMQATASDAQISKFTLNKGDVLATKDSEDPADIAVPAVVKENLPGIVCGYHLTHIKPDSKLLNGFYLFRLFQSHQFNQQFTVKANGVTRYGLPASAFSDAYVSLPPLSEQKAIAKYLNEKTNLIDATITKKQRLIELLQEERTALINKVVTRGLADSVPMKESGVEWLGMVPKHWKIRKFKYLVDSIKGGGTPSTDNSAFWKGDIPWVSPKDMKTDIIHSTEDYITTLALENSTTTLVEKDSILIVVRSGILKHTLPVATNAIPVTLNQDMKAIRSNNEVTNQYLYWMIVGYDQLLLTFTKKIGATVDSLNMESLYNFYFTYPEIDEQNEIIRYILKRRSAIDITIKKITLEVAYLQEFRTSLINEAVTGKIKIF